LTEIDFAQLAYLKPRKRAINEFCAESVKYSGLFFDFMKSPLDNPGEFI